MTTRSRLLDAAERLFADRGFHAASVREITELAGANVAAVNYHFGSKEQLLRAVTDRIVAPLNARRRELLATALEAATPPSVAAILEAFLRPDIEAMRALDERRPVVRFVGRIYSDDAPWIRDMATAQFAEVGRSFHSALAAALPDVDEEELTWRLRRVVAVVVNLFATYPGEGISPAQAETLIARLVAFLTPAMAAPAPAPNREVPRPAT